MGQGDSLTFGFEPALHRVFLGGSHLPGGSHFPGGSLSGGKHHQSTHFVESGGCQAESTVYSSRING